MNFVSSIPSSRTAFEQFLFSNAGISIDLSHNVIAVAAVAVVLAVLFKRVSNSSYGIR